MKEVSEGKKRHKAPLVRNSYQLYLKISGSFCSLFNYFPTVCEASNASRKEAFNVVVILLSTVWVSNIVYVITDMLPWFDVIGPLRSAIAAVFQFMSSAARYAMESPLRTAH